MHLRRTEHLTGLKRWAAPGFLAASIALWALAPSALLNLITPFAGGLALLGAGLYLSAVLFHMLRFAKRHQHRLTASANQQLARLWKATYVMMAVLVATFAMAVAFYFSATHLLVGMTGPGASQLLWMLTLGGLALSLAFGRLVIVLVNMVDAALRHDDN